MDVYCCGYCGKWTIVCYDLQDSFQVLEPERMPASPVPESAVTRAIEESTQLEQEHRSRTMHHFRLELYCVRVGIVIVEYCTAAGDPTLSLQVRHGLKPCALPISDPVSFVQYHSMEYHAK